MALHDLQDRVSAMDAQTLTSEFQKFSSAQARMSKDGLDAFLAAHKMAHNDEIVGVLMERMDQNHDGELDLNEFIVVFKGRTDLEMIFKSCKFERYGVGVLLQAPRRQARECAGALFGAVGRTSGRCCVRRAAAHFTSP